MTICHVDGCGESTNIDNAWAYELVVQIARNNSLCGAFPGFLSHVDYATTDVDDGDTIRTGDCSEGHRHIVRIPRGHAATLARSVRG